MYVAGVVCCPQKFVKYIFLAVKYK